jgi:hypothetical protein
MGKSISIYPVNVLFLEPIPHLNKEMLVIEVTDLSVTQLNYSVVLQNRRTRSNTIIPIIFNLKTTDEKSISLTEVYLPNRSVLATKATLLDSQSEFVELEGKKKALTKGVFDLIVLTKRGLKDTAQSIEEHQKTIEGVRQDHQVELKKLSEEYSTRLENNIRPYRENEKRLIEQLTKRDQQIRDLLTEIPQIQEKKILDFVIKNYGGEAYMNAKGGSNNVH